MLAVVTVIVTFAAVICADQSFYQLFVSSPDSRINGQPIITDEVGQNASVSPGYGFSHYWVIGEDNRVSTIYDDAFYPAGPLNLGFNGNFLYSCGTADKGGSFAKQHFHKSDYLQVLGAGTDQGSGTVFHLVFQPEEGNFLVSIFDPNNSFGPNDFLVNIRLYLPKDHQL